jgi:sigma-B regulation protein RsbU (phosphoserine phosphatase)
MSRQTDPQAMVRAYGDKIQQLTPVDRRISISRRGLTYPKYRITRSTTWNEDINPWKDRDRLPVLEGGMLTKMIYDELPVVIDDLVVPPGEPAAEYLTGVRSLLAIPMYDQGESLNMVVLFQRAPHAFPREQIPDLVWRSNLFGRATSNLVLQERLREAYQTLDQELKTVGEIQRALLPAELPNIPNLDLAAYYQQAMRAGGDYYDFFPLPEDKWGIFIADVSGHGTPAAVFMAVTHCIAHNHPGPAMPPAKVLDYLNHQLFTRYSQLNSTFVTAFYGVYDPRGQSLTYARAGHNPPRLKRCQDGSLLSFDQTGGFPLGIVADGEYADARQQLQFGDELIFYTDGITEARNPAGELFGIHRLDHELENCSLQAKALLDSVLRAVERFGEGRPADDDRTIIVARVV